MNNKIASYTLSFVLVTSLFFLWAFVHNLEPILIKHLKKACELSNFQSALIDSAVYLGYFFMAIPAGIVMKKYGYRKGIILGLLLYAVGAFLFIPAANSRAYFLFLSALFIIASGCTFLETVAPPFVTFLGKPDSATARLNLSQSFNGLGAAMAALIGSKFILSGIELSEEKKTAMSAVQLDQYLQGEADAVKLPYLIIGAVVLLVAFLFIFTRTPEPESKNEAGALRLNFLGPLRHRHLRNGFIAQFFYVAAQVCVTSFFIQFVQHTIHAKEKAAGNWLIALLFVFMLGRFVGTVLMRYFAPNRLLFFYSLIAMGLLGLCTVTHSSVALGALILVPFFESIMFPTIFSLAIRDLKEDTELGSSLIVMSIVGGAFAPLLMGWIYDQYNVQVAYIVPLVCLSVVAWYGARGYKIAN